MAKGVSSTTEDPAGLERPRETGDGTRETEVTGSTARFEMTYSPPVHGGTRAKFGPPLRSRLTSVAYLVASMVLGSVIAYAYLAAPSSSRLFVWVVEGDRGRPISASLLAVIIVASGIGTLLRTQMRGVLVRDEWIEARDLLPLGIPRSRRWAWAQVLRIVVDGSERGRVALELWDGSFERLPEVSRPRDLAEFVVAQARRRRIEVTYLESTPP